MVIATGGFANNKEMVKTYLGFDLYENIFTLFDVGSNGEGIKMAWEAGADSDGIGPHLIFGVPGPGFFDSQLPNIQGEPLLIVNQLGERFVDESIFNGVYKGNAIARQPGKCGYLIFDGDTRNGLEHDGFFLKNPFFPSDRAKNLDATIENLHEKGNRFVYSADSIEDLAEKLNIDPVALKENIDEYNSSCEKGHDDHFGKTQMFMIPVKTPRFYAFKLYPVMYGTLGGIRVNHKLEALDRDFNAIPGLYAAGYDANGVYGNPVQDYSFLTPGATYGFALNSGRIAGESAAGFVRSQHQGKGSAGTFSGKGGK